MAFFAVLALILLMGLAGLPPKRSSYLVIAALVSAATVWEYTK